MDFSVISAVIMDMDGVLWRSDQAMPGIHALFDMLRTRGIPYVLATNNATRTPADYVAKLTRLGIPGVPEKQIITSAIVTADYLQAHYPLDTPVHVLGEDGLRQTINDAGFQVADDKALVVVAGADFHVTYEKLKRATLLIRAGADFIGTNPDRTFPSSEGLVPGTGSILAALEAATDRQPFIVGKPHRPMFDTALHILGTAAPNTLMIGDRLTTDIAGAQQAGLKAALVLTGVTSPEELAASDVKPDGVYDDLPAMLRAWGE